MTDTRPTNGKAVPGTTDVVPCRQKGIAFLQWTTLCWAWLWAARVSVGVPLIPGQWLPAWLAPLIVIGIARCPVWRHHLVGRGPVRYLFTAMAVVALFWIAYGVVPYAYYTWGVGLLVFSTLCGLGKPTSEDFQWPYQLLQGMLCAALGLLPLFAWTNEPSFYFKGILTLGLLLGGLNLSLIAHDPASATRARLVLLFVAVNAAFITVSSNNSALFLGLGGAAALAVLATFRRVPSRHLPLCFWLSNLLCAAAVIGYAS